MNNYNLPEKTPAETAREDLARFTASESVGDLGTVINRVAGKMLREDQEYQQLRKTDRMAASSRWYEIYMEAYGIAMNSMKPKPPLTADEKKTKSRARSMRNVTKHWRDENRDKFDSEMSDSFDLVSNLVTEQAAVVQWFRNCIPKRDTFAGSDDNYRSVVGTFSKLAEQYDEWIDIYQTEISLYENNPLGDFQDVGEQLGLVLVYKMSNDGFVWFLDEDTGKLYFICISTSNSHKSILDDYRINSSVSPDSWKNNWHQDLQFSVVSSGRLSLRRFDDICRDYFGAYDNIRQYVAKSIAAGNSPPDSFPSDLTS